MDLRARRASRHGLARQTLARQLRSRGGLARVMTPVVAALVDPQLFVLLHSHVALSPWPAAPGGVSAPALCLGRSVLYITRFN